MKKSSLLLDRWDVLCAVGLAAICVGAWQVAGSGGVFVACGVALVFVSVIGAKKPWAS